MSRYADGMIIKGGDRVQLKGLKTESFNGIKGFVEKEVAPLAAHAMIVVLLPSTW